MDAPACPKTKNENYALYHAGHYGNHLQFWTSLDSFYHDLETGAWSKDRPVVLRTNWTPGVQLPSYGVITPCSEIPGIIAQWDSLGVPRKVIVLNEGGRDDELRLQGEIMRSTSHYNLTFTTVKKAMRAAMAEGKQQALGLQAKLIVQGAMDTPSWENLMRLFDEFPEAVIEFSSYNCLVGKLNWNTVFWEVRDY